jgi:hypothetical protein
MTWEHKAAAVLTVLLGACSSTAELAASDPYESADAGLTTTGQSGDGDGDGDGDDEQNGDEQGSEGDTGLYDLAGETDMTCDPWLQDCPADEKCTWEQVDGVAQTRCVPVEPDAKLPGEPCMVFGDPNSGYDDCVLGAMCHHLDARNQGMCIALCGGSPVEPTCVQGDAVCQVCPDCPSLCVPLCDPLAQDCAEGFACMPVSGSFACQPDDQVGKGKLGDPCEYAFQCQAGFACIDALSVPGCEGVACCSPFCSTNQPYCPQGMSCVPWFNDLAPQPLANLGVCKAV